MNLTLSIQPLLAKCAVCVAQETPYGWWWFSGTVLVGSVATALWLVWRDDRARRVG
jgi:hypothetical protein